MGGPAILFEQPAPAAASPNAVLFGYFSNFLTGSCVHDKERRISG